MNHTPMPLPATVSQEGHDEAHTRVPWRWIVLLISGLALALAAGFVWLHLASPFDGVRLEPSQRTWLPGGVVVSQVEKYPGGLEPGDVIVAIDGRSVEAWQEGLFALHAPHSQWQFGQTLTYTVQRGGHRFKVPVTLGHYSWLELIQEDWGQLLYLLAFALVGTYVFVRRPTDRATRVLFLNASTGLAASTAWSLGLHISDITGGLGFWLAMIQALVVTPVAAAATLHFVLLFPRLHPVLRGRRWIVPSLYLWPFLFTLAYFAIAHALTPGRLDWIEPRNPGSGAMILIWAVLIVLVLWSNVRARLDAVASQQIRWIVFAALLSCTTDLLLWVLPSFFLKHTFISLDAQGLLFLPIPLALAVAILRYRLFDIDHLINRTMVYGTLTVALAVVYFGLILSLQLLLHGLTEGNQLSLVASTLAIVILFQPLRRRIQRIIDRRFYRRKYDAARTVETFSTTLRNEVDLNQLREHLLTVVQDTMQPSHLSLWLREPASKSSRPERMQP